MSLVQWQEGLQVDPFLDGYRLGDHEAFISWTIFYTHARNIHFIKRNYTFRDIQSHPEIPFVIIKEFIIRTCVWPWSHTSRCNELFYLFLHSPHFRTRTHARTHVCLLFCCVMWCMYVRARVCVWFHFVFTFWVSLLSYGNVLKFIFERNYISYFTFSTIYNFIWFKKLFNRAGDLYQLRRLFFFLSNSVIDFINCFIMFYRIEDLYQSILVIILRPVSSLYFV